MEKFIKNYLANSKIIIRILFFSLFICSAYCSSAQQPVIEKQKIKLDKALVRSKLLTPKTAPVADSQCGKQSAVFQNSLQHKELYIPGEGAAAATVPKIVKIRFMIPDPGTPDKNNFRPEDIKVFDTFVSILNDLFAHTDEPTKPLRDICGDCYIADTRIRFELQGVTFFKSEPFAHFKEPDQTANLIDPDHVLHIFMAYFPVTKGYAGITNPKGGGIRNLDFNTNYNNNYIILSNIYQRYLKGDRRDICVLMMHELFHEYSLDHLWQTNQCNQMSIDYLADIYGTGDQMHCPQTGKWQDCNTSSPGYDTLTCDNNVLAIHGDTWASPMQIGIIHRESFMGRMHGYTFPAEPPNLHPWTIDSSQAWDFPIRMFQDIVIEKDVTFTVKCKIEMPEGSRIILQPGSKLIIDGGQITSYYDGANWQGVRVENVRKRRRNTVAQGIVEIMHEGTMKNIKGR